MKRTYLLSRKGVTLIELLIVLALISIIIGASVSMFVFGQNTFRKGNQQFEVQSSVRLVSDYIQDELRYATYVELMDAPDFEDEFSYIYFDGNNRLVNRIWDFTNDTHTTKFQSSYTLSNPTFPTSSEPMIYVSVDADEQSQNYSLDTSLSTPNLSLHNAGVIAGYPSGASNYSTIKYSKKADKLQLATTGAPTVIPAPITNIPDQSEVWIDDGYSEITLSAARGTIYYTINSADDITSSGIEYTTPISLSGYSDGTTINLKAVARIDSDNSEILERSFTIRNGALLANLLIEESNNTNSNKGDVNLTPGFTSKTLTYTGSLKNNTGYVHVTATPRSGSTASGNVGTNIAVGATGITLTITVSKPGLSNTVYTIVLTK